MASLCEARATLGFPSLAQLHVMLYDIASCHAMLTYHGTTHALVCHVALRRIVYVLLLSIYIYIEREREIDR